MSRDAPTFYVMVQPEGKPEAERFDGTASVVSFEYEDNEKKADLLKLSVKNFDLSNFDNPIWKQGNRLIFAWGYPGNMTPAREAVIQKVTGSTMLTVEAQAKSVLMNKEVRSRTFENTQRSEIVHALAKEYGYDDDHRDIEETPTVFPVITQARSTDAQFIKRLADLEGFEFYVDFDGFHWHKRRLGQKPLRILQYYLPPDVGDIISFNVENDIFAKPAKVVAKGRDPLDKKDVTGEASDEKTERQALAPVTAIVDPVTGAITQAKNIASSEVRPTTETSNAQAKREVEGTFRRTQQTAVKLTLNLVGDPGIVAKSVLEIRGISKRLSGLYYVNKATHKVGTDYQLAIACSTDGTNGHSENIIARETVATKSKKEQNQNAGQKTDVGKLNEKVVMVDPASGQVATQYTDTVGRT